MKPDRRAELRRLEDASFRTTASHDNEVLKATIDEQEGIIEGQDKSITDLQERIKALESLLARVGNRFYEVIHFGHDSKIDKPILDEIDAILPKTDGENNG